ncbi:hypothetical protein O3628_07635 [Streptococcus anginosus]|uniref:hypothetical protein n=1 Tax=Streptococcus anginosus TaxID=1328 RepID=UPI000B2399F6
MKVTRGNVELETKSTTCFILLAASNSVVIQSLTRNFPEPIARSSAWVVFPPKK